MQFVVAEGTNFKLNIMKIVYIAGFEAAKENSVSGWNWTFTGTERNDIYENWKKEGGGYYIYKGEITVNNDLTKSEITEFVENYLSENDYDLTFTEFRILV